MNRKNILLIAIIALLILSGSLLFYHRYPADKPGRIEGFYGFNWEEELTEETKNRLEENFGTPHLTYSGEEEFIEGQIKIRGFRVEKLYNRNLGAESSTVSFWFHNRRGLIRGILSIRFTENDIQTKISELRQTLQNNYPELQEFKPVEKLDNIILYRERPTNSTITINYSEPPRVKIIYNSPLLAGENLQSI